MASGRVCCACILLTSASALCRPAIAAPSSTKQAFAIPRQPVVDAIRQLTEASDFQILYAPALLQGLRSTPIGGAMTAREALVGLLGGTGIEVIDIAPGTATLRRAIDGGSPGESARSIPPVVVTARRFTELLTDVPIAISVLSGKSMERRGTQSVAQALQDVPGVSVYDGGAGISKISIRGVSTSLGGNENGFYLDDLPFSGVSVPITPDVRTWDLERIEVLRGPQGTLFGEGSMGGTIRVLTNNAQLDRLAFAAQAGLSQTDGGGASRASKVMLNVPIIDNMLAMRVAATDETLAGWLDDQPSARRDINPGHVRTARLRALFQPFDRLRMNATYWQYDGRYLAGTSTTDTGFAPLAGPRLDAYPSYTVKGISATYNLDGVDVFYGYASNRYRLRMQGVFNGGAFDSNIAIGVATHELRLSSNSRMPWRWTGGVYWRRSGRDDVWSYPREAIDQQGTTTSRTVSIYGDVTYTLASLPLEASLGSRHFRDHLVGHDSNYGIATRPDDAIFTSNSPRLSLSYRPREEWQVYASASKGFRSGQRQVTGFDRIASAASLSFPSVVAPDTIWTYELGTKIASADRRVGAEFALYHNDWKDVAVRLPLGTSGLNALVNSPGTRTDGVDTALAFVLTSSLKASLGASCADARYAGSVPGTGIRHGRPVDDVPRFLASANLEYSLSPVAGWMLTARAGIQHASAHRSAVFPENKPGDTINNLNARISLIKGPWTLAVYGENLINDRGAASLRTVVPLGANASEADSPRLRPRTVGIELTIATD